MRKFAGKKQKHGLLFFVLKNRGRWLFFQGPMLENSWFCPRKFSPEILQKKTQGHILTGITSGDQTLLAPLLFFIFFLSWHFYFQKEFDPSCYSRQNVSLGFSAGEKQKTPSGQNHEFSRESLPEGVFAEILQNFKGHILTGITTGMRLFLKIKMP